MKYLDQNQGAGSLTTYKVTLLGGEDKRIDGTFSTVRCLAATSPFIISIEGSEFTFDKGIGQSRPRHPDLGQPIFETMYIRNPGGGSISVELVAGIGDVQDNRLNFVSGGSYLDVRPQFVPAPNFNWPGAGPLPLTTGSTANIPAELLRKSLTVTNCGVVPLLINRLLSTAGQKIAPGETVSLDPNFAWVIYNPFNYTGYYTWLSASEAPYP
jgi:hypothetical protein